MGVNRRFLLWVVLAGVAGALTGLVDNAVGLNYGAEILITVMVVALLLYLSQRYPGRRADGRGLTSVAAHK